VYPRIPPARKHFVVNFTERRLRARAAGPRCVRDTTRIPARAMWLLLLALACTSRGDCGLDHVDIARVLRSAERGRANRCELGGLREWIDRRRATHGPWKQDIGVARSADGLLWEAVRNTDGSPHVVIPGAAVPEVVEAPDGRLWLYFVDGDLDDLLEGASNPENGFAERGLPGVGALGAAVSTDGLSFQRVADAQIRGLGVGLFADPDIVPIPRGGWRMFYLAMGVDEYTRAATWEAGEKHAIHTAVSRDLVRWAAEGLAVHGPYADPSLACFEGGNCTLFSYGLDTSTSVGGGPLTYQGPWSGTKGFAPEVLSQSPREARVYFNDTTKGAPLKVKRTTDAGQTWQDELGASLDVYGEAATVVRRRDGTWWMYFHMFKPGARLESVPDPDPESYPDGE